MATTLTPILSAFWDDPKSWTLETYDAPRRATRPSTRPSAWSRRRSSRPSRTPRLRGRGGAGFPTGMKWSFMAPPDGGPRYLVVNADESEPGTCKDVPLMMATPHVLIEGVAISSFAIGCEHAFIYLRGEVVHVYRRLLRAVEEAYAAGHLGQERPRHRRQPRHHRARRRRRLHLRRGDRAPRQPRGPSRPAAQQAAVPRRRRPLRPSDVGQQRRVDRLGAAASSSRASTGSPAWAPRSPPASASSACPAT